MKTANTTQVLRVYVSAWLLTFADLLVKGFGLREDAGLDFILYGDEAAS